MTGESYEGYPNRETWQVHLIVSNDEGWQRTVLQALRQSALRQSYEDYLSDEPEAYGIPDGLTRDGYDRYLASRAGDIVRKNVEAVLDPDTTGADKYADQALRFMRDEFRHVRDIGSLWRVDWTDLGQRFLTDANEIPED